MARARFIAIGCACFDDPTWAPDELFAPIPKWRIELVGDNPSAPVGWRPANSTLVYTATFREFLRVAELSETSVGEGVTWNSISGMVRLTEQHAQAFEAAHARLKALFPNDIPVDCRCRECIGDRGKFSHHYANSNSQLALSEWFSYWMRWALDNCECPAILIN